MRQSDTLWCGLILTILTYEFQAPKEELLSHAVWRYHRAHPWLMRAFVILTALHLLECLPKWMDPYVILYGVRVTIERLLGAIPLLLGTLAETL